MLAPQQQSLPRKTAHSSSYCEPIQVGAQVFSTLRRPIKSAIYTIENVVSLERSGLLVLLGGGFQRIEEVVVLLASLVSIESAKLPQRPSYGKFLGGVDGSPPSFYLLGGIWLT